MYQTKPIQNEAITNYKSTIPKHDEDRIMNLTKIQAKLSKCG